MDAANRRFLAAVRTLALVRKLAVPALTGQHRKEAGERGRLGTGKAGVNLSYHGKGRLLARPGVGVTVVGETGVHYGGFQSVFARAGTAARPESKGSLLQEAERPMRHPPESVRARSDRVTDSARIAALRL